MSPFGSRQLRVLRRISAGRWRPVRPGCTRMIGPPTQLCTPRKGTTSRRRRRTGRVIRSRRPLENRRPTDSVLNTEPATDLPQSRQDPSSLITIVDARTVPDLLRQCDLVRALHVHECSGHQHHPTGRIGDMRDDPSERQRALNEIAIALLTQALFAVDRFLTKLAKVRRRTGWVGVTHDY
jgi:hypothetical protein